MTKNMKERKNLIKLIKQNPDKTRADLLNMPEVYNNAQLFHELLFMSDQEFDSIKAQSQQKQNERSQQRREYNQARYAILTEIKEIKQILHEIKQILKEASK